MRIRGERRKKRRGKERKEAAVFILRGVNNGWLGALHGNRTDMK